MHARGAGRLPRARGRERDRLRDAGARRVPARQRHGDRRGGGRRRAAVPVLPARPARLPARRAAPLPRCRRPRDQVPPACGELQPRPPGAPGSVRPRRGGAPPDPLSRRARNPRAGPPLDRGLRPPPEPAPHPRSRGDLRPRLDLARSAGAPQPLLRHLLVVAQRHPGAVRARPARPDPHGERRPLRDAGVRGDDGAASRAAGRSLAGRAARCARRPGAPLWSSASRRSTSDRRPATRRCRATR